MIGYIYTNITTGEIDIFPCPIEEAASIHNSLYDTRFPVEEYVFLKTDIFTSWKVIYNRSSYV